MKSDSHSVSSAAFPRLGGKTHSGKFCPEDRGESSAQVRAKAVSTHRGSYSEDRASGSPYG